MPVDAFLSLPAYLSSMEGEDHVLLKIDTSQPVALLDFVALFVGVGNQFERFTARSDEEVTARFYVKEVRAGCIEAELIPWAIAASGPALATVFAGIKHANDLATFVRTYGGKLSPYFEPGGRDPVASKSDLADYHRTLAAVAHDPSATLTMSAISYDDGKRKVREVFHFATPAAREGERQIEHHRDELEQTTAADHSRVLMSFVRTETPHAKAGKRSNDRVRIEALGPRALPIVYASDLAEQRIRHEITEADENVYKKAFDVDVNVELRDGRPIAYRVVGVHSVIDPTDDCPELNV